MFRNEEKLLEAEKISGSQIAKFNNGGFFSYSGSIYNHGKKVNREIDCYILKEAGNSFEQIYSIDGKIVFVERNNCKEYIVKEK